MANNHTTLQPHNAHDHTAVYTVAGSPTTNSTPSTTGPCTGRVKPIVGSKHSPHLPHDVAEARGQKVLHHLLAEVVVDAVLLVFRERLAQRLHQLAATVQVTSKGFLGERE